MFKFCKDGFFRTGYKTLLLAVYKTSLFSKGPKWLVIRPHIFFEVTRWLFIKPYFFLKAQIFKRSFSRFRFYNRYFQDKMKGSYLRRNSFNFPTARKSRKKPIGPIDGPVIIYNIAENEINDDWNFIKKSTRSAANSG